MKTLVSALMISFSLVAGAAQAANSGAAAPSTKTRAQVIAELHEAKAMGLLSTGQEDYPVAYPEHSFKTRARVQAELDAARAAGTLSNGEEDYPPATATHSSETRAQVQAELIAARTSGDIPDPAH